MSWGPQQPIINASPPPGEDHKPSRFAWAKTLLLGIIVLIVLPYWLYQTLDNWYNQRSTENLDEIASSIMSYSHSEILLAEAAESHDLPSSLQWMLSTRTPDKAVGNAIALLNQYKEDFPEFATHTGVNLQLASLYLRSGDLEMARTTASELDAPYPDIISTLADGKALSEIQLDALEEHKKQHPHFSEAASLYAMHLKNAAQNTTAPVPTMEALDESELTERKLLYRSIGTGFCYTCLAFALVYLLINLRTISTLQPPPIAPTFLGGLFVFLLLEYLAIYSYQSLGILNQKLPSLPPTASFIIMDLLYRLIPALGAFFYLKTIKGKDTPSVLGTFAQTLPAACIFWGVGIFTYFFIHHYLTPHLIGDYLTGLEGLIGLANSPQLAIYPIIATVLIAPFAEELLFRGILLPSLQSKLGTFIALFLSSLLFSLVHIQGITGTLTTFILGGLLGLTYLKTRSLWPGIIAHAGFNAWLHFDTWNVYLAS